MIEKFSPELCQHLSILVPGFEGHRRYREITRRDTEMYVDYVVYCLVPDYGKIDGDICPAWQVEDVLRELQLILVKYVDSEKGITIYQVAENIAGELALDPDTAYQKIEEYLWSILS